LLAGDTLKTKLRSLGHRCTSQREAIVKAIIDSPEKHLSAEQVYGALSGEESGAAMATVYRTLDLLEQIGILRKVDFGEGRARYEVITESGHQHHHLVCLECGKVQEVRQDLLSALEALVADEYGFEVKDHMLQFYGVCAECKPKSRKSR